MITITEVQQQLITFINQYIDYLCTHKRRLARIGIVGLFGSILLIFTEDIFTSLPGTIYLYYFIFIFIYTVLFSDSDNKPDQTAVALSIETSVLIISLFSGLYILLVYTDILTITEGVSQTVLFTIYASIIIPIYFKSIFFIGSKVNILLTYLYNQYVK